MCRVLMILCGAALIGTTLTLPGNAQQPPKWGDRKSATPGVQITLQETTREKIQGMTHVTYRLVLSGLPDDKTYQLWEEEDSVFSQVPHDFKANELNGMDFTLTEYAKGEPFRLIVTSNDRTVKAFAEVFPFPIEARDGPCHLWAEIIPKTRGTAFAFYGEGFAPDEEITTISQSDGEIIKKTAKIPVDGSLPPFIIQPAVTGKPSGTATFSVAGKSCAPAVTYQWGPPAREVQ